MTVASHLWTLDVIAGAAAVLAVVAIVLSLRWRRVAVERQARLAFIERQTTGMIRSMRQARPTPREGVEAGLELIRLTATRELFVEGAPAPELILPDDDSDVA